MGKIMSYSGWFCVVIMFVFFKTTPSLAFYSNTSDKFDLALGGFVGVGGGVAKYPGDGLYPENSGDSWFGDFRLLADAGLGSDLTATLNVLQNVRSSPLFSFSATGPLQNDVDRSGIFYWQQHDTENTQSAMVLDAAYITYGNRSNELTVGRQPVTTTVTFFFTPNDFFAPFSPNTFFRVYKPGVDALRYERRLEALSQLSVIGVLGYEPDPKTDSGWSNAPDWERSTILGRMTYTVGEFEWGGLAGVVRESLTTGLSLQGEFFDWLGVRAEGHYAASWGDNQDSGLMATISLEHRFQSSLTMRLEYMYNGYGSDSIADALAERLTGISGQGYLGRHYTAFDFSYEITPLIFGEILYLRNWSDDSYTVSLNGVCSVSNESELALTASLPGGNEPLPTGIRSELGSLPVQLSVEYRHYF